MQKALVAVVSALLLSLFSFSCGTDVFNVTVLFPSQEDLDNTRFLKVFVLIPGQQSSCNALREGSAEPGDDGYEEEYGYEINLEDGEVLKPLQNVGPGNRLFYAEAWNLQEDLFLRGCTLAAAGDEGLREVAIQLLHGGNNE